MTDKVIAAIEEVLERMWDHSYNRGATNEVVIELGDYVRQLKEEQNRMNSVAEELYNQLVQADSCIAYDTLGPHRQHLSRDISRAIREYTQLKGQYGNNG